MNHNAYSIKLPNGEQDKLKQVYADMIGTVMATAISVQLKNNDYDGEVRAGGTVKVNRLKTAVSQNYGTARTLGKGNYIVNNPVYVNIDQRKEIVEEIQNYDVERTSVADIISKRQQNHALAMSIQLDKDYFVALQQAAVNNGLVNVSLLTTVEDKLLKLIQTLESVENENVDKVDRELMVLTLAPKWYDAVIKYMNTLPNPQGQDHMYFHGVRVMRAPRQGFDAIVQVRGAVAQPVAVTPYAPERIPLSNDIAITLFYDYGTKAVMPDLVFACALDTDISA